MPWRAAAAAPAAAGRHRACPDAGPHGAPWPPHQLADSLKVMLAAGRELALQDQARLRNRALAAWALSAGLAAQHSNVTCDLREHAGLTYAVVATFDCQVLAWYRVTDPAGRLRLRRETPDLPPAAFLAADPPAIHARSADLRARSQALAALSSQLRSRSGSAHARAAQLTRDAARARSHFMQLLGGPGTGPDLPSLADFGDAGTATAGTAVRGVPPGAVPEATPPVHAPDIKVPRVNADGEQAQRT